METTTRDYKWVTKGRNINEQFLLWPVALDSAPVRPQTLLLSPHLPLYDCYNHVRLRQETRNRLFTQGKSPRASPRMEDIGKVEDLMSEGTGELKTKVERASKFLGTIQGQKEQIVQALGEEKREVLDKVDGMVEKTNEYKKKIDDAQGDQGALNGIQEEWKADAKKMYEEDGLADIVKTGQEFKAKAAETAQQLGGAAGKIGGLF